MLAPAGAQFKSKSVWQMLEKNYQTFCALHNTPVDPDLDMKEKIHTILVVGVAILFCHHLNCGAHAQEGEFDQLRSAKMDIDDFLRCAYAHCASANIR